MKKFLLLLFVPIIAFAHESHYIMGVRNSKYAFIGYEYNSCWGFVFENSVFTQDIPYQYMRSALYYKFDAPFNITGSYAIYAGTRYDRGFYDIGGVLNIEWEPVKKHLKFSGFFQPYHDSDLGQKNGYSLNIQTIPLEEIGLIIGLRNVPEFRDTGQRLFGGLIFALPHMTILPEISTPTDCHWETTRFSISFIYRNKI